MKAHSCDFIQFYFMVGLRHGEILLLLCTVDDLMMDMQTGIRILYVCASEDREVTLS